MWKERIQEGEAPRDPRYYREALAHSITGQGGDNWLLQRWLSHMAPGGRVGDFYVGVEMEKGKD